MHVCLCAVSNSCMHFKHVWIQEPACQHFFCFAVCNYKFSNLAHTYWHVQSRFLHVALVLVVVLLLGALVLVVLVFVLVLMVVLGWLVLVLLVPVLLVVLLLLAMVLVVVLVVRAGGGGGGGGAGPRAGAAGAGGGGGGSVGGMNFGTSFAPRSPTSFAPRHNCNKVRVLFYFIGLRDKYWVLLLSVPRVHCKVLQTSETEHCFFLLITMQIGLIEWKFADFWVWWRARVEWAELWRWQSEC